MTKMTKTQVEQLAAKHAFSDTEAKSLTVEQLEAMTWEARRDKARELAHAATTVACGLANLGKWTGDYTNAYESRVHAAWGGLIKQRENARRAFKTACSGLSVEDAYRKINGIVQSFNIRGLRPSSSDYRSEITVERAWGVGGSVYFRYDSRIDIDPIVNPEDERQRAYGHSLSVEFSWSSTGRTMAEALASVNLYKELIDVAAEVEAVMSHERVVSVYGLPEPEAKPAEEPVATTTDTVKEESR